ncbi:MAG: indolepyruvate oxidoreductase subunit beta family protein [Hyphomicrobiales bacterium]|nr:indolepyruvate oxidoreductase subunit beta family protein [Hyphomicrobiales bacterium]MBV8826319.1 indolepyruvate oxidoreductase subunit beta family protein [Hyphomicrobiales bacterium]
MSAAPDTVRPIKIAILAMGGEGGGVLADWIIDVAEHADYLAQTTSVPGVAQRTGATIYYLELFPRAAARARGKDPVLALIPVPGDVDVVIASELMEAGRAVQRGFVTPDCTTLIASTHRVFSMTERTALADGRVDAARLQEACTLAAKRLIAFDMAGLAEATGSVISAVLFGALAGADLLPFPRAAFEAAIERGGVGVAASLSAFRAGFDAAAAGRTAAAAAPVVSSTTAAKPGSLAALLDEAAHTYPQIADIVRAGVERVADYQDIGYARRYLARLSSIAPLARERNGERLLAETARQLALAMAYEDTIRVAELKIRASRFARVREEVRLGDGQLLQIAEFMHPRVQEIADTLPAGFGRWLLDTRWARRLVERFTKSGKVVKTTSLRGFLLLYLVAALKPMRPRSLRFAAEQTAIDQWLGVVRDTARTDAALATEVAETRNLVRGYGDTHERGRDRFDALMAVLPQVMTLPDSAARFAALRKAAQADESGAELNRAIAALPKLSQAAE